MDWDRIAHLVREREPSPPRPVAQAEIDAAEAALGLPLPRSYVEFTRRVGHVQWPVVIDTPEAIAGSHPSPGLPPDLLLFGSDGSGLRWAFDVRRRVEGEYAVVAIDPEEGFHPADRPCGARGGFGGWLQERLADALEREEEERRERLLRRVQGLEPLLAPFVKLPPGWTPGGAEIAAAEARLGCRLPADYAAFSRCFGALDWPFSILDVTEVAWVDTSSGPVLRFAGEGDVAWGFRRGSQQVVRVAGVSGHDSGERFIDWITGLLAARHRAAVEQREAARSAARVVRRRRKGPD